MNALLLLMGLLVLSYIGSFLVGGRAIRGFGLPSGSEYLVLGFIIGPNVLGLVERSMLDAFEPIADAALGWLAFVLGLDYAFLGRRRVRLSSLVVACSIALATGAAVGATEYVVMARFTTLDGTTLLLLAGGIGAACSETTRDAVRWVVERHRARGPLANLLGEIADSDDVVPLVATALLFALAPVEHASVELPGMAWAGITLVLGVLLGLLTSVLLGRESRLHESWGVLLGTSLFAIGLAVRLNLSFLAMMFFMGIALAGSSRHRDEVAAMIAPTERPVLLPALVLAGARISPRATPDLAWIIGTAIAVRLLVKLAVGFLVWAGYRVARPAGASLGLGLLPTGALAMAVGLSFALRFPGVVGDTILITVAAVTVFGEFVGPARMRVSLMRAGEIPDAKTAPSEVALGSPSSGPEALGP
ncbi:MAG TPA: cation:proton antiporter [Polyangiaceae bacterium]|nr:cation:proton antiporter [Polyangiaceae bacterium]